MARSYDGRIERLFALLATSTLLLAACEPPRVAASPAPSSTAPSPSATPAPSVRGLASAPHAIVGPVRAWYTVPDPAFREDLRVAVTFPDADPTAGAPLARLRSNGRVAELRREPSLPASWQAMLPLDGVIPGDQRVEIVVRLTSGEDAVVGSRDFKVSAPEYIVWTLDFEGDATSDATMANTEALSTAHGVPMTIMWNPRAWTTTQVSRDRADAMQRWAENMAKTAGAEIALHLHAWTDFVRDAGVAPRTSPNWAGRSDGYDVPLTAFTEGETRQLIDHALKLMADHGMSRPTSFRGGGLFANAANLRAVAATGFNADCSGAPAGVFGRVPLPWTLAKDAQPYRPSRDDANASGDLPLLEAPTIGGNTFGYTSFSIDRIVKDDLAMLAPTGQPAAQKRTLTIVSHPGTIDATERAAIETLFRAFEPLRYDRDTGPLRFVTLAQLAKAYSP